MPCFGRSTPTFLWLLSVLTWAPIQAQDLNETLSNSLDSTPASTTSNRSVQNLTTGSIKTRVADLHYGTALYHFFQGAPLQALTELKLAEARGGIQGHGDNPAIMQAAISLSYGMADEAQYTFTRLLDQNRPEHVRNTAWYYLARLYYLREDWPQATQAANRIRSAIDDSLVAPVHMLRTDLAIRTGKLDDALVLIKDQRAYGRSLPFALFNVASALSRNKQYKTATTFYEDAVKALFKNQPITEEDLALADRIRTAAGYNHIFQKRYEDAVKQFEAVQLSSLDSDMALLGYGRASAKMSDYRSALKPWTELARRSIIAPAAQEALLSMPVAYEQLGAINEALTAYQHAEKVYVAEIARIHELLGYIKDNSLDSIAVLHEPENWFEARADLASAPKARQLAELFSLNRFQAQLHEFQDINELRALTTEWADRLNIYSDMLVEREVTRNSNRNQYLEKKRLIAIDNLASHTSDLREKVTRIRDDKNYLALQADDAASLQARVTLSEKRISELNKQGEDTSEHQEALRRYKGLLLWDAAENFSSALYATEQNVTSVEAEVAELREKDLRVQSIFSSSPEIQPYQQRIASMQTQLTESEAALDQLIAKSEQRILDHIADELRTQQIRLKAYLSHTRLAIARIYDSRSRGSEK